MSIKAWLLIVCNVGIYAIILALSCTGLKKNQTKFVKCMESIPMINVFKATEYFGMYMYVAKY